MTTKLKRMWGSSDTEPQKVFHERLEAIREALQEGSLETALYGDRILSTPALGIGSTDTSVATGAFNFQIGAAAAAVNTFKAKAAVAAGTALAAGTIPMNKWGLYLFSIAANGTITCTPAAANFSTGYNSEALAIAALPATPANQAAIGYVTVLTEVGSTFVGNTDALEGGASGNPSADTNYFNAGANFSGTAALLSAALDALDELVVLE